MFTEKMFSRSIRINSKISNCRKDEFDRSSSRRKSTVSFALEFDLFCPGIRIVVTRELFYLFSTIYSPFTYATNLTLRRFASFFFSYKFLNWRLNEFYFFFSKVCQVLRDASITIHEISFDKTILLYDE